MSRVMTWTNYVNSQGDFELPSYMFRLINDLMKTSLDMGSLLSNDPGKLRAFKEQTKAIFKKRWLDVAQALESFGIIDPCGCLSQNYCTRCSGSRFVLSAALSPDRIREISLVIGANEDPAITKKLQDGLDKALAELER